MKHGHAPANNYSPTYVTWKAIIQRCTNPNNPAYAHYGGRGIGVCEEWLQFENFLKDMGERPANLTLDRIDVDRGYFKENCRWATDEQQAHNQRLRKDNRSGVKGVIWRQSRYYATVRVNGKLIYLYSGPSFFDAVCARKSWESKNVHRL